jgi:hypothetical protein
MDTASSRGRRSRALGRSLALSLALAAAVVPAPAPALAFVDTSSWVGAEYTPTSASSALWWWRFDAFRPQVERELALAARRLGTNTLRMFLHSMVFEANASALLANMDAFADIALGHGMSVIWTLFDDCWDHSGGSLSSECRPVPGGCGLCWMASPQDVDRTSVARYRPYVEAVVRAFGNDTRRVRAIETFNEPNLGSAFSAELRNAAYTWAKALGPAVPILSLWDDSNVTDVLDHHDYTSAFATEWRPAVFRAPLKGGVITEAGSRWFQPPYSSDAGSPLLVVNFLAALRLQAANGSAPFVPGAMISWELMTGNVNARWHWSSKLGSAEPAIPWCGWLLPDGTPVSHTEAAALRRYVSGVDEFLFFEDFLPKPAAVVDGNAFLTLPAGAAWLPGTAAPIEDALVEAAVWLTANSTFSLVVRAFNSSAPPPPGPPPPGPPPACIAEPALLNGSDVCAGGPPGWRNLDVSGAPQPVEACAAACCAWAGAGAADSCNSFVVSPGPAAENCSAPTTTACCWLKLDCRDTTPTPCAGCTAAFVRDPYPPPGPPEPAGVDGYHVSISFAERSLSVWRRQGPGAGTLLGSVNISARENAIVPEAWSLVRAAVATQGGPAGGSTASGAVISVWWNPNFRDTGYVGEPEDLARTPLPIAPLLVVVDASPLAAGGLGLLAGGGEMQVDYVSALPVTVL